MVPIKAIKNASKGPALPPIAAKMILTERAHFNPPTIVFPSVSTPP